MMNTLSHDCSFLLPSDTDMAGEKCTLHWNTAVSLDSLSGLVLSPLAHDALLTWRLGIEA
jgi:hypothetical protein